MAVTKVTTHNTDALARLLYQYRDSTNLKSLITAIFGTQVQDIENAIYQLMTRLDIDNSEGDQLDGIGEIVGQERQGLSDDLYKLWLKAKIGKNTSEGDLERVISIWSLFNPDATVIHIYEYFPASISISSNSALDPVYASYLTEILGFMQGIVCAGISVSTIIVFDPDNAFGFYGATDAGGFGDLNDSEVGGEFSYIEIE